MNKNIQYSSKQATYDSNLNSTQKYFWKMWLTLNRYKISFRIRRFFCWVFLDTNYKKYLSFLPFHLRFLGLSESIDDISFFYLVYMLFKQTCKSFSLIAKFVHLSHYASNMHNHIVPCIVSVFGSDYEHLFRNMYISHFLIIFFVFVWGR